MSIRILLCNKFANILGVSYGKYNYFLIFQPRLFNNELLGYKFSLLHGVKYTGL